MEYIKIDNLKKTRNSLDSLSPYVGKMRPELADWIIDSFAYERGIIYDPFAGSGTVLLEGWKKGHHVVGTDLNEYAVMLAKGKTEPYENCDMAINSLESYKIKVRQWLDRHDGIQSPDWVSVFFHPDTLRETYAWVQVLKYHREWFLLSCLLGILHHQRPGFLSYPSSHGAPYLRVNKYPQKDYPEMYQYREVFPRLIAKVMRVYKEFPELDFSITREVYKKDASKMRMNVGNVETIITSPPYMKSLTYARDNRLRLWFLGEKDWKELDKTISPEKGYFFKEMLSCFKKWSKIQPQGARCVVVIGNLETTYMGKRSSMPEALVDISANNYKLIEAYIDPIPGKRKVVKGDTKVKQEVVLLVP